MISLCFSLLPLGCCISLWWWSDLLMVQILALGKMPLVGVLVCLYTIKNIEWAGNSFQQSCISFLELFCSAEIPFFSLPLPIPLTAHLFSTVAC